MNKVKILFKYILIFIILIIMYFSLLLLASLIPSSAIRENVEKSSVKLLELGEKKEYELKYKKESIFTFTDALMINTAYSIDSSHPIESLLLARRSYIPGQTLIINEETKDVMSSSMYMNGKDSYQTKELYGLMHNDGNTEAFEYPRYWHGYLIFLRPLLLFFDYNIIRIISCIGFIALTVMLSIILSKKINKITGIIVLISMILLNIFIISTCLNEITTYYIAIVASIILCLKYEKIKKNIGIFFFIIGSFTSFVDLFTTPLITVAIPLIIYFLIKQNSNEEKGIKQIIEVIRLSIIWGLGYGFTWITKWVLVDVILNRNVILEAINQVLFRSVSRNEILLTDTKLQLAYIKMYLGDYLLIAMTILIIIYMVIKIVKDKNKNIKINVANILPYLIIMLYPIIWFFVVKQHTLKHMFFTNRIIIITVITFQIIIAILLGYYDKKRVHGERKGDLE